MLGPEYSGHIRSISVIAADGLDPLCQQAISSPDICQWFFIDLFRYYHYTEIGRNNSLSDVCLSVSVTFQPRNLLSNSWYPKVYVTRDHPWLERYHMVTSSNRNIFSVTGRLWGKSTSHRQIPLTKASDEELWCFLWSALEQEVGLTIETPVIWDAIALIMTSL